MIGLNSEVKSVPKGMAGAYLHSIRHQIAAQIGKWAILKDYLIRILDANQGEYQYWDDSGNCRGRGIKTIDSTAIMTNDTQLVFLDAI